VFVRGREERQLVERLIATGLNDCAIARETGIPRTTVRDWRRRPVAVSEPRSRCWRCDGDESPPDPHLYAYLLGVYLGDGHISGGPRGVHRLRIFCDARYPILVETIASAIGGVCPGQVVDRRPASRANANCIVVSAYWKHWPCVFPQHGPGAKHDRRIVLAPWQRAIVDAHPEQLVRGLIHTDGWRGNNRVTANGKAYTYARYTFCQVSDDIRAIFCDALDMLDISWRRMNANNISIARRDAVARLDAFIEPKR
jgi:hypothetical protein